MIVMSSEFQRRKSPELSGIEPHGLSYSLGWLLLVPLLDMGMEDFIGIARARLAVSSTPRDQRLWRFDSLTPAIERLADAYLDSGPKFLSFFPPGCG
jgi:hypothetical protein